MRIIPVVDILNSVAVHAFAGQRRWYRPVQSVLAETTDPAKLLAAITRRYHIRECYIADIDRIQGRQLNADIIQQIADSGIDVMLEAGIRTADDLSQIPQRAIRQIVVGSETMTGLNVLHRLADTVGPERLVFSIDLQRGELLTSNADWLDTPPLEVFQQVEETGVRNFILLDLVSIGTGGGVTTLPLYHQIRQCSPAATIIIGGGVRTLRDVRQLVEAGVDGALMASAFHHGSVSPQQLQALLMETAVQPDADAAHE